MKNVFFFVFLLISGCGSLVNNPPTKTISYDHDFPWIENAMYLAIDFWNEHDTIVSDGAERETDLFIDVKELSPDRIAQCSCVPLGTGTIDLVPGLFRQTDSYISCTIAHEIGHSFGMNHVEQDPPSLMSPGVTQEHDGSCRWSIEDQKEFDRAKYQ